MGKNESVDSRFGWDELTLFMPMSWPGRSPLPRPACLFLGPIFQRFLRMKWQNSASFQELEIGGRRSQFANRPPDRQSVSADLGSTHSQIRLLSKSALINLLRMQCDGRVPHGRYAANLVHECRRPHHRWPPPCPPPKPRWAPPPKPPPPRNPPPPRKPPKPPRNPPRPHPPPPMITGGQ